MKMSRRSFVARSVAVAGAAALQQVASGNGAKSRAHAAPQRPPRQAEKLTAYQLGPHIWFRWANVVLTSYRAHPTQKYPYLYPLTGPASGLSLTTETSLPYPHHRSLIFACDRVNGANYWQAGLDAGQIISDGPQLGEVTDTTAVLTDSCQWKPDPDRTVMRDRRTVTVCVPDDHLRLIDFDITWTAVEDVTIPQTNHSLFAIRAAGDIVPWGGGTLVNSKGQSGEKATFGQTAEWATFFGVRRLPDGQPVRDDLFEGIALFDHPENPWAPTPWFTRDYGFLSPTPLFFRDKPWQLKAGQSVRLRYRVVLYAGTPESVGLDKLFRQWVG